MSDKWDHEPTAGELGLCSGSTEPRPDELSVANDTIMELIDERDRAEAKVAELRERLALIVRVCDATNDDSTIITYVRALAVQR